MTEKYTKQTLSTYNSDVLKQTFWANIVLELY